MGTTRGVYKENQITGNGEEGVTDSERSQVCKEDHLDHLLEMVRFSVLKSSLFTSLFTTGGVLKDNFNYNVIVRHQLPNRHGHISLNQP